MGGGASFGMLTAFHTIIKCWESDDLNIGFGLGPGEENTRSEKELNLFRYCMTLLTGDPAQVSLWGVAA